MIKQINKHPSPILFKKARECPQAFLSGIVENNEKIFWSPEVVQHIKDLKDTADTSETAIGLASCQIWDNDMQAPLSVFVIKIPTSEKEYKWHEFINPKIRTSGKTVKFNEKCLSVDKPVKPKRRESNVEIEYNTLDSTTRFKEKLFLKDSFLPIVLQHEYDHLLGKTIA